MNSLFKEKQKFKNPFLRIILLIGIFIPLVIVWNKIDTNQSIEDNIFENFGLIFLTILIFCLIAFIYLCQLKLSINQYGIFIKFYPLLKRSVSWSNIKKVNIVDCDFTSIFGISFNPKYESAFNIDAKKGLHLTLKNNKELIIGIKNTKKLKKVINTYSGVHDFKLEDQNKN